MHDESQLLELLAKELASHPDEVRVEKTIDERGVLLTLHVNQEDIARFVGKKGNHARAVRTILRWHGAKNDKRVSMKIHEDPEQREAFERRKSEELNV